MRKTSYVILAGFHVQGLRDKFPDFFKASDYNFLSFELGMNKPDVRIYEAVLAKLGATPGECVFLDDNQDNVEGAEAAGLIAFCYSTERPKIKAGCTQMFAVPAKSTDCFLWFLFCGDECELSEWI